MFKQSIVLLIAWAVIDAALSPSAFAQWKPDRPVELVVFAAAGGGNDKAAHHSFSARKRSSRGARKPDRLPGSSIGSLPK